MIKPLRSLAIGGALTALLFGPMVPESEAGEVYNGKAVTIIVPNAPSGLMVQYARMIAPHLARHLGARDVRVDVQQGAGGLKGTNVLWRSKPDGMTIAFTSVPTLILAQLAGSPGVQFDATRFTYLGRVAAEPRVLVVGGTSKIASVEDLKKLDRPFIFASQGTDEDFYVMSVLSHALGYKMKIVTGYEGNSDTALAVIKGDADGHMTAWTASQAAVRNGDKRVLLMMGSKGSSELPDVPAAAEAGGDPREKENPCCHHHDPGDGPRVLRPAWHGSGSDQGDACGNRGRNEES